MQIGTNGGGYYGANSAYPFQNPNPASNILEIILMLLMPTVMCFVYGEILGKKEGEQTNTLGFIRTFRNQPDHRIHSQPDLGFRHGGSVWRILLSLLDCCHDCGNDRFS